MDSAYEISKFIVSAEFSDLPQGAIELAKKEILDSIANMVGGSQDDAVRGIYRLVKCWGGGEESTVIIHGGRFPAPNAAFVNSTMASALAYHDTHERGHIHTSSVIIPTALAISELKGNTSGKDFINAICIAIELGCRLGIATKSAKPQILMGGWSYGPLLGNFTSAIVSGKILELNTSDMHNALGIAYNQLSGNAQGVADLAATEKLGYGFASRNGITSTLLAQRGLTGAKRIFDECETSFFNMYHAGCRREILVKELGQKYEMLDMSFKPYPGCRMCHRYFDTIVKTARENQIEPGEIEEIIPYIFMHEEELCVPKQQKECPDNTMAAYFSLPWAIACGVVRSKLGIDEFGKKALKDPALLDMATKVTYKVDTSLSDEVTPTKIVIKTNKGVFESKTTNPRGSLQNPLSLKDIESKLLDCANVSAKTVSKEKLSQLVNMVENLEEVKNIAELLNFFT